MSQASGPPQNQQQQDTPDPVTKFNMCLPILKKSLTNVMKVAGQVFEQNAQVDTCTKYGDPALQSKLDKCLEEFYSSCDEIELNLRLAIDSYQQTLDSTKNTPLPVQGRSGKLDPTQPGGPEPQAYSQYLSTVKAQINCAKEIHDILVESARKMGEKQVMQPHMSQQQMGQQQMGQQQMGQQQMGQQQMGQPQMQQNPQQQQQQLPMQMQSMQAHAMQH